MAHRRPHLARQGQQCVSRPDVPGAPCEREAEHGRGDPRDPLHPREPRADRPNRLAHRVLAGRNRAGGLSREPCRLATRPAGARRRSARRAAHRRTVPRLGQGDPAVPGEASTKPRRRVQGRSGRRATRAPLRRRLGPSRRIDVRRRPDRTTPDAGAAGHRRCVHEGGPSPPGRAREPGRPPRARIRRARGHVRVRRRHARADPSPTSDRWARSSGAAGDATREPRCTARRGRSRDRRGHPFLARREMDRSAARSGRRSRSGDGAARAGHDAARRDDVRGPLGIGAQGGPGEGRTAPRQHHEGRKAGRPARSAHQTGAPVPPRLLRHAAPLPRALPGARRGRDADRRSAPERRARAVRLAERDCADREGSLRGPRRGLLRLPDGRHGNREDPRCRHPARGRRLRGRAPRTALLPDDARARSSLARGAVRPGVRPRPPVRRIGRGRPDRPPAGSLRGGPGGSRRHGFGEPDVVATVAARRTRGRHGTYGGRGRRGGLASTAVARFGARPPGHARAGPRRTRRPEPRRDGSCRLRSSSARSIT